MSGSDPPGAAGAEFVAGGFAAGQRASGSVGRSARGPPQSTAGPTEDANRRPFRRGGARRDRESL